MYGNKDAAREAAKDFAREPKPAAAPPADPLQAVVDKIQAPAEATKPAEAAKPAEKPKAVAVATPGATNVAPAKAPAAPAAAADAGGDEKYIYYLQAGAFREIADAESARAKLALLGFEANVSDRATDTGVLHRVRLGPYQQVEAMNRVRSKLSENGVDVAVVRNQK